MSERLLRDIEASHALLVERTGAGEDHRRGLRAVYEAITAALQGITESDLNCSPSPEEWSMVEVAEHVAEHDRKYIELVGQGLDHYVEHGLEHALQLWRMRPRMGATDP